MKKTFGLLLVIVLALGLGITACGGDDGGDEEENNCTTVCADKDCGEFEGCTCGACGEGETCSAAGKCEAQSDECATACADLECGMVDECDCGTCEEGETCTEGMCEAGEDPCDAACTDIECGMVDECDCGTCDEGTCVENVCTVCEPVCQDDDGNPYECGDDGCEGSCGDCPSGDQYACVDNMCECTPDCDGKDCGTDGCGGSCGECGEDTPNCTPMGTCVAECPFPEEWSDNVLKLNHLEIGEGGLPGMALDVDEDPNTCAPAENCSDGLNNQLGGLLTQLATYVDANAELKGILEEGGLILLAELKDAAIDGTAFLMNMYIGEIIDPVETCDWQAEKCNYYVKAESFDITTCDPIIMFDNATVNGTDFLAGGTDYLFSVAVPITDGALLMVTAYMARIEGTVVIEDDVIVGMTDAIVGGAVPKALIMEAVDQLPEDLDLPVSKDLIKSMLDMFIVPDVDTDDDGEADGASVGIQFAAIEGAITGMEPADAE